MLEGPVQVGAPFQPHQGCGPPAITITFNVWTLVVKINSFIEKLFVLLKFHLTNICEPFPWNVDFPSVYKLDDIGDRVPF